MALQGQRRDRTALCEKEESKGKEAQEPIEPAAPRRGGIKMLQAAETSKVGGKGGQAQEPTDVSQMPQGHRQDGFRAEEQASASRQEQQSEDGPRVDQDYDGQPSTRVSPDVKLDARKPVCFRCHGSHDQAQMMTCETKNCMMALHVCCLHTPGSQAARDCQGDMGWTCNACSRAEALAAADALAPGPSARPTVPPDMAQVSTDRGKEPDSVDTLALPTTAFSKKRERSETTEAQRTDHVDGNEEATTAKRRCLPTAPESSGKPKRGANRFRMRSWRTRNLEVKG